MIKLLDNPPKAGKVFKREVYTCQLKDITETVIRTMKEKLYTHVPVYDGLRFIGVFSETTIVDWLVDNIDEGRAQFYKRTISDVNSKYLHTPWESRDERYNPN